MANSAIPQQGGSLVLGRDGTDQRICAWQGLIAPAVITLCMFLLIGSVLSAEFYLVEDHHLLGMQPWTITSWLQRVQSDVADFQRFRPMYWAYVAVGATWFGRNPHVWHFFAIMWGVLSLCLLYRSARRVGASVCASTLFIAVLGFSSSQSWIWINLVPQETLGVALLSIACWAFIVAADHPRRLVWDILGYIALVLSSLCKESFILVVPAVLMMRLVRERQVTNKPWLRCVASLRALLLAGTVLFVVGITTMLIVMISKPTGYSANATNLSLASFAPLHWGRLLFKLGLSIPLSIAFVVMIVYAIRLPERRGLLIGSALVILAWVLPQLVLYTRGIDERYLFPAVIGIAAAIALGYSIVSRRLLYVPEILILALILPVMLNGGRWANKTANWFTAETVSTHRMVQFLAQNGAAGRSVLLVGDPSTGYGYEALYSLPIYLKLAGAQAEVLSWPMESLQSPVYSRSADASVNQKPSIPDPGEVDAIILIDTFTPGLNLEPLDRWMNGSQWRELMFSEAYRHWATNSAFQLESGVVTHKILVPAPASGLKSNALISIAADVADVGVSPLLDGPPWGLERDYLGPGQIAWLGQGDSQGLGGTLIATALREVTLTVEAVPGPSRGGSERTVELVLGHLGDQRIIQKKFTGDTWVFRIELRQGENPFRLRILDTPTVTMLPNGDTRTLMALVRKVKVSQ